ncbi:MAG: hydrogenase maturation nickel metallochaperone HypA [Lentisphaeria bacterium]
MHEMSLAVGVAELVAAELAKQPGRHLLRVAVRVGTLAGVEIEALRSCLEIVADDAGWGTAERVLEMEAAAAACLACGAEFAPRPADYRCPVCASGRTELRRGQSVYVDWMEVDEGP